MNSEKFALPQNKTLLLTLFSFFLTNFISGIVISWYAAHFLLDTDDNIQLTMTDYLLSGTSEIFFSLFNFLFELVLFFIILQLLTSSEIKSKRYIFSSFLLVYSIINVISIFTISFRFNNSIILPITLSILKTVLLVLFIRKVFIKSNVEKNIIFKSILSISVIFIINILFLIGIHIVPRFF